MSTRNRTHPARRPDLPADDRTGRPATPAGARLPLVLAVVALLVAGLALAWTALGPNGPAADCQARAWDSIPAAPDLPAGWSVETSNFFVGNLSVTLTGPPAGEETGEGAIYATVTCYGSDGGEALARSRVAEQSSGNTTVDLTGIGETGYTVEDATGAVSSYHFRRNDLVAYVVIAGTVSSEELRAMAQAFDGAIRTARAGDVPSPAAPATQPASTPGLEPTADASVPPASAAPSAGPPTGLATRLPTEVDGTPMLTDTATGADILQDDPGSRSMTAALRALGKTPADLEVAQAYDEADELDLYFVAFRLPGADADAFRTLILQSWLVADAEGVTIEETELAGKPMTRVDYGDDLADAWVYSDDDTVILMHTSSDELAEAGAAALP